MDVRRIAVERGRYNIPNIGQTVDNVSVAFGNVVLADHGLSLTGEHLGHREGIGRGMRGVVHQPQPVGGEVARLAGTHHEHAALVGKRVHDRHHRLAADAVAADGVAHSIGMSPRSGFYRRRKG